MTELVKSVQKLEIPSNLVVLFELELDTDISTNTYAYFHEGLNSDLSEVKFRSFTADSNGKYNSQTYTAIPIHATGFETTTGPSARPTLTIANILTVFGDALDGLTNEDLLGKKVIRRKTLFKYCVDQSGDQGLYTAPIEFPRETYIIDRIASETPLFVSFELASPFDLEGITLPRRQVVGQGCPWRYQAGDESLDVANREGGCTWNRFSRVVDTDNQTYTHFVNKADDPVIPLGYAPTSNYTSNSAITKNYIYRQQKTGLRIVDVDGTTRDNDDTTNPVYDYWQATATEDNPGTPSDDNTFFRRVRVYRAWSTHSSPKAYTNTNYNEFYSYTIGSSSLDKRTLEDHPRLFKVKNQSLHGGFRRLGDPAPKYPLIGSYWERGDICGKTMNSCMQRYQFTNTNINSNSDKGPNIDRNESKTLQFGGYPTSRKYSG
tara:strand:+ start:635 stop:1936 length:1302 start_codon:yes stop_codon:yes gene_type:complete